MQKLVTAETMKNIEKHYMSECNISEIPLMKRAAEALQNRLYSLIDTHKLCTERIVIVCGGGNNGGDGYALAELLFIGGYEPEVVTIDEPKTEAACHYYEKIRDKALLFSKVPAKCLELIENATIIVDCIFGFGFDTKRVPNVIIPEVIKYINLSRAFVFSVDLPSGVSASDGTVLATGNGNYTAVNANATITFTLPKVGLYSYPARRFAGEIYVENIGIEIPEKEEFFDYIIESDILSQLPQKGLNTSKKDFGTLISFCGCADMPGAASLAAKSALRAGVGLLVCVSDEECIRVLKNKLDEPVFFSYETNMEGDIILNSLSKRINDYFDKATAILCGCGLGIAGNKKDMISAFAEERIPLILDADAINMLDGELLEKLKKRKIPAIITPHPGEMSRLVKRSATDIQNNRYSVAKEFAAKYNIITVLKGAHTVVAMPTGKTYICTQGNPGMAKAGSGDVLAGLISSLCAQGISPEISAVMGVYIHSASGDRLRDKYGEYSFLSGDIPGEYCHFLK